MDSPRVPVDVAQRFGANLKRCRKAGDLSQERLGFRAELHRTEVGMLERGIRLPRIDTLVKLSSSLGIPPGDLLVGLGWTSPDTAVNGGFTIQSEAEC